MILASEAYKRSSESYDFIAKVEFEAFKIRADKIIAEAISLGRWYCSISCGSKARTLAYQWLESYGYKVKFDFDRIFIDWSECE